MGKGYVWVFIWLVLTAVNATGTVLSIRYGNIGEAIFCAGAMICSILAASWSVDG